MEIMFTKSIHENWSEANLDEIIASMKFDKDGILCVDIMPKNVSHYLPIYIGFGEWEIDRTRDNITISGIIDIHMDYIEKVVVYEDKVIMESEDFLFHLYQYVEEGVA